MGISEIVPRINERLTHVILVGHRRNGRHLGDHAQACHHALMRVRNIGGIVIKGRHRAHHTAHHRHGMGIAAETGEEAVHLLVHHCVVRHAIVEIFLLGLGWQFAVKQQIAGLQKIAVLGQLLNRITPVEKNAFIAVDIGDLGFAACGGSEAGVVGEHPGVFVKRGDVDDIRAHATLQDLKFVPVFLAANFQLRSWFGHRNHLSLQGTWRQKTVAQIKMAGGRAREIANAFPPWCQARAASEYCSAARSR